MSKFFENIRDRFKNIPNLIVKRLVHVCILGDSIQFELPPIVQSQTLKRYIEDLIIKVNDVILYDASTYPFDYDFKLEDKIYPNKDILEIFDKRLIIGEKPGFIVPNRSNITPGFHKVVIASHSRGVRSSFNKYISIAPEKSKTPTPQIAKENNYLQCNYCGKKSSDLNQVICEYCGSTLKE
jgi:hypothetical protein